MRRCSLALENGAGVHVQVARGGISGVTQPPTGEIVLAVFVAQAGQVGLYLDQNGQIVVHHRFIGASPNSSKTSLAWVYHLWASS